MGELEYCSHGRTAPVEVVNGLPDSQAGSGRHIPDSQGTGLAGAQIRLMHSIMGVRRENLATDSKVVKPAASRRGR